MAATGKTPILLYGSTTASNVPSAGNLTNSSDGCEIAINVADKNLFFKDSTNAVNTVPIRQSSASSNGWLSSTDWSTFNGKAPAFTYTSGYIPYGQGTTTPRQSSSLTFDGTTLATNSFTATGTSLVGYDGGQYTNQLGVSSLVPYLAQYKWTGSGSNYYATKVINNEGVWTLQTAAAAAVGSHSFSTVFQVAQSGGVSIGNTTDPGATNLSVSGYTGSQSFRPTSNTTPTNGMYLYGTNVLGFATNTTRALLIDASQNLISGTDSAIGRITGVAASDSTRSIVAGNFGSANTSDGLFYAYSGTARNTTFNFFTGQNASGIDIIIYGNGNIQNRNNSYAGISDAKLKENEILAGSQWNDVKALSKLVKKYNFKDDVKKQVQLGWIAQDVQTVSPGLVEETFDRDEEGNQLETTTLSVKYSVAYMKAFKALGEALERIEQLEQKLAAANIA